MHDHAHERVANALCGAFPRVADAAVVETPVTSADGSTVADVVKLDNSQDSESSWRCRL